MGYLKHTLMLEGKINTTEGDDNLNAQINGLRKEIDEKEDDMQHMESLNKTLIVKEHTSNRELQDARKELISI
ncbi:hypothetical protein F0562_026165 [Nyssa sinensis]|uniref:Uncharacterized protein n=1 Tax=Nyssa sinensis TaxID=561372 RepID=A0A5J5B8G2_9ASTE|nr:hypothetical protein F0562_026165 [Nyssa sinensis]